MRFETTCSADSKRPDQNMDASPPPSVPLTEGLFRPRHVVGRLSTKAGTKRRTICDGRLAWVGMTPGQRYEILRGCASR